MRQFNDTGLAILVEITRRLASIDPLEFTAPEYPAPPPRLKFLGEATDYQKALVTLRDQIAEEHERLHIKNDMAFGGHIGLPVDHEYLHVAPAVLETMLNINLANTFKELSGDVPYYISPNWKVHLVREPIGRKPPKHGPKVRTC